MPIAYVIIGIILIFLVLSGRATNFVNAAQGNPISPVVPPSGSSLWNMPNNSSDVGTYTNGTVPSGYVPDSSLFGNFPSVTYSKQQMGWINGDSNLLGDQAVMEYNYGFPANTSNPVKLVGGINDTYKLVYQNPDPGVGIDEVWKLETGPFTGAHFGYLHLLKGSDATVGAERPGGSQVGYSGWPLSSEYGVGGAHGPSNAHLAVAVDQLGLGWLHAHG